MRLHLAYIWKLGTHSQATCYYKLHKIWQTARWRCRLESRCTLKRKPPAPRPALQGSAEGPRQPLCLPKGLDTVAQLAPTGPWQQPGAQPKQCKLTAKKATNNRQLSLYTSTPPYCLALSTRSRALIYHSQQIIAVWSATRQHTQITEFSILF